MALLSTCVVLFLTYDVRSASPPYVSSVEPADGAQALDNTTLEYQITDGTGIDHGGIVDGTGEVEGVGLTVDCFPLTPTISKSGAVTTVSYSPAAFPTLWPQGINTAELSFKDGRGDSLNYQYTFVVSLGPTADLAVQSLSWLIGGILSIDYKNQGAPLTASASGALYWADGTDVADELPHEPPIFTFPIPCGSGAAGLMQVQVPASTFGSPPAGATYVLVVLDPDNLIVESDKANNVSAAALPVILDAFVVKPSPVEGGSQTFGIAFLSGPAPADGAALNLRCNTRWAVNTRPAPQVAIFADTPVVPEGQLSSSFAINTTPYLYTLAFYVTAQYGTVTKVTPNVIVTPPPIQTFGSEADARVSSIIEDFLDGANGDPKQAFTDVIDTRQTDPAVAQDIYLAAADHYFQTLTIVLDNPQIKAVIAPITALGLVPVYELRKVVEAIISHFGYGMQASQPTRLSLEWGEIGVANGVEMLLGLPLFPSPGDGLKLSTAWLYGQSPPEAK